MPVFECSRKVQVFGTSLAMTIPSLFVKANEVEKGSVMNVLYGLEGVMVVSSEGDPKEILNCLMSIMDMLEEKVRNHRFKDGRDG